VCVYIYRTVPRGTHAHLLRVRERCVRGLHVSATGATVLEEEAVCARYAPGVKRGVFIWHKRPVHKAQEAYLYGKRRLFIWHKRPIHMAQEAYSYGKRGLFIWQKRPIHMAQEAYSYGTRTRDLICKSQEYVHFATRDLVRGKEDIFLTLAYLEEKVLWESRIVPDTCIFI